MAGPEVMLALKVGASIMQFEAGRQAKKQYNAQARYKQLEGRIEAVKEKERGNEVLRRINIAMAENAAVAAATNINPISGTIRDRINQGILRPGATDFYTSRDNATIALLNANAQAQDLRAAGQQAFRQGMIGAATTLASGFDDFSGIGSAPAASTTSVAPTIATSSAAPLPGSLRYNVANRNMMSFR